MRSTLLFSLFAPLALAAKPQETVTIWNSGLPPFQEVFAGSVLGARGPTTTYLVGCSPLSCGSATIINAPSTFSADVDILVNQAGTTGSWTQTISCEVTPSATLDIAGIARAACTGDFTGSGDDWPTPTLHIEDAKTLIATAKVTLQEYIPGVQTPGAAAPTQVATVLGVAGIMAGIGAALL